MSEAGTRTRRCVTSTWSTRCTSCGAATSFVTCGCDARVLLDDLWPKPVVHDCEATWMRQRVRRSAITGDVLIDLTDAPAHPVGIPHAIEPAGLRVWRPGHHVEAVHDVAPLGGYRATLDGRIHTVQRSVDPYRLLGMRRGTISRTSLQELAEGPVGLLTLHRPSRRGDDHVDAYALFVPSPLLAQARPGTTLSAEVEGRVIVGQRSWWYARGLRLY